MIAHSIGLLRVRDRTEISPLGVFSSGRREPAPLPEFRLNYPHCIYSLIGWIAACPAEEVWWPRMGSHHRRPARGGRILRQPAGREPAGPAVGPPDRPHQGLARPEGVSVLAIIQIQTGFKLKTDSQAIAPVFHATKTNTAAGVIDQAVAGELRLVVVAAAAAAGFRLDAAYANVCDAIQVTEDCASATPQAPRAARAMRDFFISCAPDIECRIAQVMADFQQAIRHCPKKGLKVLQQGGASFSSVSPCFNVGALQREYLFLTFSEMAFTNTRYTEKPCMAVWALWVYYFMPANIAGNQATCGRVSRAHGTLS